MAPMRDVGARWKDVKINHSSFIFISISGQGRQGRVEKIDNFHHVYYHSLWLSNLYVPYFCWKCTFPRNKEDSSSSLTLYIMMPCNFVNFTSIHNWEIPAKNSTSKVWTRKGGAQLIPMSYRLHCASKQQY